MQVLMEFKIFQSEGREAFVNKDMSFVENAVNCLSAAKCLHLLATLCISKPMHQKRVSKGCVVFKIEFQVIEECNHFICVVFPQGMPGPAGLKGESGDPGPQVSDTAVYITSTFPQNDTINCWCPGVRGCKRLKDPYRNRVPVVSKGL